MRARLALWATFATLIWVQSARASPPAVDRSSIHTERKADGAVQDKNATDPKTQGGGPAFSETPSLTTDQQTKGDGNQRNEEGTEFWPPVLGYRIKITDSLLVLFTAVLAIVTTGLHISTKRLWLDSREQTRIQSETREIALAALDRPYVLVEAVAVRFVQGSQNFLVYFDFHIRNYGKGPAIIQHIVANGFLSSGRRGERARDNYPSRFFPRVDQISELLGDRPSVRVFPEVFPGILSLEPFEIGFHIRQSTIVLSPGDKSPNFSHFAKDIHLPINADLKIMYEEMPPWLIGRITYADVFDRKHVTNFCFRARSDGIAEEYGDAPYNQRT